MVELKSAVIYLSKPGNRQVKAPANDEEPSIVVLFDDNDDDDDC